MYTGFLGDIPGKGIRQQTPVFQYHFSRTAPDTLRMAGKIPAESDDRQ